MISDFPNGMKNDIISSSVLKLDREFYFTWSACLSISLNSEAYVFWASYSHMRISSRISIIFTSRNSFSIQIMMVLRVWDHLHKNGKKKPATLWLDNGYQNNLCSNENYLSSSEKRASKKFRPLLDLKPWPLRYLCSALPTELTSQL